MEKGAKEILEEFLEQCKVHTNIARILDVMDVTDDEFEWAVQSLKDVHT